MVDLKFPYPSLVASLGMVGSWVASTIACSAPNWVKRQQRFSLEFALTSTLPTGLAMAGATYLGNLSYLYLSVAFVQMLKALTPVATFTCGSLLGLERPTPRLAAAVALVTAGVMAASCREGRFSAYGLAVMVASVAAEAVRLCVTQMLMSRRGMHPLEALSHLAPACAFWMLLLAAATEVPDVLRRGKLAVPAAHLWCFAASSAAGFCLNTAAFCVVNMSSALSFKVLGICKDIGLVVFSALVLREHVGGGQLAGYAVALAGVAYYNSVKTRQSAADAKAREGPGLPAAPAAPAPAGVRAGRAPGYGPAEGCRG